MLPVIRTYHELFQVGIDPGGYDIEPLGKSKKYPDAPRGLESFSVFEYIITGYGFQDGEEFRRSMVSYFHAILRFYNFPWGN